MNTEANKTRQLLLPLLIIVGMVMAVSWIIAGDGILNSLRGNDQGLAIQDPGTPTPSPSNTPSPSATRGESASTSAATLMDTPTPTPPASAAGTESNTQESNFTPNCTYTIDYWLVNTDSWRIGIIDFGSRSYSKEQAIAILNIEDPNLVTTRLLQQYIITLLNTMKGADPSGIEKTIEQVSEWLILHPPEIGLTQAEELEGETLADELQDFNDGVTGPGLCIDETLSPTPGATPTPTPSARATGTEAIFTQESNSTANCTYTIHYWRAFTETWRIVSIDLGDRTYSKEQTIAILNIEEPNLVITRLLQQYIITVLNTLKGADPSGIERTMELVSDWLILHPPEIRLTQAEKLEGETFADELQDFNDGVTGPGLCLDEPLTPTPGATPTPLNYTPPATATRTPGPIGTIIFPTATPTKKPGGGKPKPTNTPPQPTNTSPPPPPSNTPQPTSTLVNPTPPPP